MIFNGNELSYGSDTVESIMLLKLIIYNNVLFLLDDLVGKIAALINQYYEYGTSKGQIFWQWYVLSMLWCDIQKVCIHSLLFYTFISSRYM